MRNLNLDPAEASSTQSTENLQKQNSRKSLILRCQRILFSAYRSDQYADPDGFLASLGAVLEQYPNEVIIYITDPRTGVQRGKIFPPTIAEIVAACDARIADLARQERFRNWGKPDPEQLQIEQQRKARPTREELEAKYGENWGLTSIAERPKSNFKAPTPEELAKHYATHNLGFQPKQEGQ